MIGELLLRVIVTTLAWGGLCAAVALFWFFGLPVLFRWQGALARWASPINLIRLAMGAFALAIAVLVWATLFELIGALL